MPTSLAATRPRSRRRTLSRAACWPKVSLHLPLRDAPPELVRRTLDSLAALHYPGLEVLVVDTHTTQPDLWEAVAEHCARLGPEFRFYHLGAWPGFRAGALNFALRETAPDVALVGVLKAGQVVRADWLRQAVPLFRDATVGLAQSQLAPPPGHCSRMRAAEPCHPLLPGDSLPLLRAGALRQAGGWDEASLCPEAVLGLALLHRGWTTALLPQPMGRSLTEEDFSSWQARRERQAAGSVAALRGAVARRGQGRPLPSLGVGRALAPVAMDALALVAVAISLGCATLMLQEGAPDHLPPLLWPLLMLLALLPLLRAACLGWPGGLGAVALSWRLGRAGWHGLLGGHTAPTGGTRLEAVLVALLLGAGLALLLTRPHAEAALWAGLLLVQAVPGLATLAVAVLPGAVPAHVLGFRRHTA